MEESSFILKETAFDELMSFVNKIDNIHLKKLIETVFEDNEIATAIGTGGININLTSQVTGYEIDAIRRSEYNRLEGDDIFIEDIEGINESYIDGLHEASIETVAEFLRTGIGPRV